MGRRILDVGNLPERNAARPVGEGTREHRPVLSVVQSNNEIRALQIQERQRRAGGGGVGVRNPPGGEARASMLRQFAFGNQMDCKPSGKRLPREVLRRRVMIENRLGKAAAVKIASADEQNASHEWNHSASPVKCRGSLAFSSCAPGAQRMFARMITLIAGTNRPASSTRRVAREIEGIYAKLQVPLAVLDLAELPPEIFAPASYATKPAAFQRFRDGVVQSSGLVVVTPEYNGGMPGVMKYFIDMLPFPESFEQRPVCFVGLAAGMWGALRPVEQLQMIFGYRNAYLYPERVFLPKVHTLFDEGGRFSDEASLERLRDQATGFVEFVRRLQSVAA